VKAAVEAFRQHHPHLKMHLIDELDKHAEEVLSRLSGLGRNSDSLIAAEAILEGVPRESWDWLFADCIVAEYQARKHEVWAKDARSRLERSFEAEKALGIVRQFLNIPLPPHAEDAEDPVVDAHEMLGRAIELERSAHRHYLKTVSRKTTPDAALSHGIGWIRESVSALCARAGRSAEPRYVAAIASAALGNEITSDAARKAKGPRDRQA
jgi:hypothetical protein